MNTWWIGGTFSRKNVEQAAPGKKVIGIVAVGFGVTSGVAHKSKTAAEVSSYEGPAPQWFADGVQAALLAPTALNSNASGSSAQAAKFPSAKTAAHSAARTSAS